MQSFNVNINIFFNSQSELWTIGTNKPMLTSHTIETGLDFILMPISAEICPH